MKCKTCGHETPDKPKIIVIDGWAYDTETTQKGVLFEDIQYPKNGVLWEASDFSKMTKKHYKQLNLKYDWFFITQPLAWQTKYVARFCANSDWAVLYCDGDPRSSDSALGVRFKYKVKKKEALE